MISSNLAIAGLWSRGPIQVAPGQYHLQYADGTPFFYLADTAWNGALLSSAADWDEYLRDRAAKRFTAIQFIAMAPWAGAYTDADGLTAFELKPRLVINEEFFRRIDQRIDAINAAGLLAVPVLFWAANFGTSARFNPGHSLAEAELLHLGRFMVDRYENRHVLWILAGDGHYGWRRRSRWKRLGRAIFNGRPHAPVAMHPMGLHWPARAFDRESWLDMHSYQTSHNDGPQTLKFLHQGPPTRDWARLHPRPVINLEPCYEGIRNFARGAAGPFTANEVRRAVYASLLNTPTAGVTYGAHGVWSWQSTASEPLNHAGVGVAQPWRQAMALAGSEDMRRTAELFTSIPWWLLRPVPWLGPQRDLQRCVSMAATKDGLVVAYLPCGGEVPLASEINLRRVEWFNPRTGDRTKAQSSARLVAPDEHDWVLLAQRRN